MPLEKMERWSGPAACLAGPLLAAGVLLISGGANATRYPTAALIVVVAAFLLSLPLFALALFGLYRRLAARGDRLNTLAFAAAMTGLLLYNAADVPLFLSWGGVLPFTNLEAIAIPVGLLAFGLMALGLVVMGISSLATGALGRWSFAPALVGTAMIALIATFGVAGESEPSTVAMLLYALAWVLLGVALWRAYDGVPGAALPA